MTEAIRDQLRAALADRYAIERELGKGGMATVYLARDVKHARHVALKVLDPELGAVLGAERFLSEIRVTANLQHPNLLPLFDSGEADGLLFYVMPYVEGETLRHRLERERQLPVDEAVRIACAVANALDYAHGHGVIHRDLKPENILLQHGQPVVADFGIALAVRNAGGQRVTQTGLSLGTPQYMSPEQATGDRVIDGRTDVYSLGAVTYEMLAGEPPHTGTNAQTVIAKLMTEEPRPLTVLRRAVPPHVEAAVLGALEKLPADRFATAKEFADALQGRGTSGVTTRVAVRARGTPSAARRAVPWVVAGALGLLAGGAATDAWHTAHGAAPESVHFTVDPPAGMTLRASASVRTFALSGDGRAILFTAGPQGALYLRRLDQVESTPVANLVSLLTFEFSGDGNWVAYHGPAGSLEKVRLDGGASGGAPAVLAERSTGWFAWTHGRDLVQVDAAGLWRMSAADGTRRLIAARDSTVDGAWESPSILGDGKTVAFRIVSRFVPRSVTTSFRLALVSIDGGTRAILDPDVQNVVGYAEGFLIYGTREGRLMGVRFDLGRRTVRGEPMVLLERVAVQRRFGVAAALGSNGTLAYVTGASSTRVDVVDLRGVTLTTLPVESHRFGRVYWSPDGTRLLLLSGAPGEAELWVYDTTTRVTTRLTNLGDVRTARWMPDGKRVAFLATAKDVGLVAHSVPADGSAAPEPIPAAARVAPHGAFELSPDGKYMTAFVVPQPGVTRAARYVAVALDGGSAPIAMLADGLPVVSPDGRWMAYTSAESGRPELYVRPFPTGTGRLQVSATGASGVEWSADGRQLFYNGAGAYHVATLDLSDALPRLVRTDSLFANVGTNDWAVHPDGKRFVLLRDAGEGPKLVVVTNWLPGALARLRAGPGPR